MSDTIFVLTEIRARSREACTSDMVGSEESSFISDHAAKHSRCHITHFEINMEMRNNRDDDYLWHYLLFTNGADLRNL